MLVKKYDEKFSDSTGEDLTVAHQQLNLSNGEWIGRRKLCDKLGERVTDELHASFVSAMDYLAQQPLAYTVKGFIMQFREMKGGAQGGGKTIFGCHIPHVQVNKFDKKRYTHVVARVKKCFVDVKVIAPGTGKITVNGNDYGEFRSLQAREVLLCPMIVTDLLGEIDIEGKTKEESSTGEMVVPRAIRHGTALSIAALFPDKKEILRLSGLLTQDVRKKERHKIYHAGARARWIWKKR